METVQAFWSQKGQEIRGWTLLNPKTSQTKDLLYKWYFFCRGVRWACPLSGKWSVRFSGYLWATYFCSINFLRQWQKKMVGHGSEGNNFPRENCIHIWIPPYRSLWPFCFAEELKHLIIPQLQILEKSKKLTTFSHSFATKHDHQQHFFGFGCFPRTVRESRQNRSPSSPGNSSKFPTIFPQKHLNSAQPLGE